MSSLGLEEVPIYRRDTVLFEWLLEDEEGNALTDLTGWTAKFSGKENLDDDDADAVFNLTVTIVPEESKAYLELPASAVEAGRYVAELRLLKAAVVSPAATAKERTVSQFVLVVKKDVL